MRQRSISATVMSASGLGHHSPKQVAIRCRVRSAPFGRFGVRAAVFSGLRSRDRGHLPPQVIVGRDGRVAAIHEGYSESEIAALIKEINSLWFAVAGSAAPQRRFKLTHRADITSVSRLSPRSQAVRDHTAR